jgi:hypothetical protein
MIGKLLFVQAARKRHRDRAIEKRNLGFYCKYLLEQHGAIGIAMQFSVLDVYVAFEYASRVNPRTSIKTSSTLSLMQIKTPVAESF